MPEELDELLTEQDDDSPVIKKLRNKLKEATNQDKNKAGEVEKLQTQIDNLKREKLLSDAGYGNLSDIKKRALLRELEPEEEPDVTKVASLAEELGYSASNETTNNGTKTEETNEEENVENPEVNSALDALTLVEKANRAAKTGGPNVKDFNQKVKETKTREELRALVQREGHKHGIIHEFDTV